MLLNHYPTLTIAFDLMLADNVAQAAVYDQIRAKVHKESLEPVGIFDRAEAELSKLSDEDLKELCMGEADTIPVSDEAQEVLSALFEMIC
jgi:hypothetical protein